MSKKNVAEEVNKRIKDLLDQKAAELLSLKEKIDDAEKEKAKAEADMEKATKDTDLTTYTRAKKAICDSASAVEMYSTRYKQLETKGFVSEEESDEVFDSLKAYEKELSEEYESEVRPLLEKLDEINKKYKADIAEAENTMRMWERDIHLNYRSDYATYPNGTNRSDHPVPIRPRPYLGCALSERVYNFLLVEEGMRIRYGKEG